jgi:hypothetical protein
MKQLLFILWILVALGLTQTTQAQTHYEPGKAYTFESNGIAYVVTYDKEGNATVLRKTSQEKASKTHLLGNTDQFTNFFAPENEPASFEPKTAEVLNDYWVIPFSADGQAMRAGGVNNQNPVTIICRCKTAKDPSNTELCSASILINGTNATVSCSPTQCYSSCEPGKASIGGREYNGSVLMLWAKNVTMK